MNNSISIFWYTIMICIGLALNFVLDFWNPNANVLSQYFGKYILAFISHFTIIFSLIVLGEIHLKMT